MPVTDDEIIRRRLLIDGDGGTDDKRINNLLKMFIKSCDLTQPDDGNAVYMKMLTILAQCNYMMEKSVLVTEMNLTEQSHYTDLSGEIENKLQEASAKISAAKEELKEAKQIRKNRQEYDSLAKVIEQQPDRQMSHSKLKELEDELNSHKVTKDALEQKLELRRKQFHVLVSAIHDLMDVIKDDDSAETTNMDTS